MNVRSRCLRSTPVAALLVAACIPTHAFPQELPEPTVHWAYASFFGTGWYKLSNQQSAFVLNMSPRWTSGETDWSFADDRGSTYTIRVPVSIGVNQLNFDDVPGILDPENLSSVSVGLSADVDVPVSSRFSFRPNAQLSYGTVIGNSDDAWTYRADVRARYTFESGKLDWALIGTVGLVGYDANEGVDDSFTFAGLGVEFGYPVSWLTTSDTQSILYWHLTYTDLLNRIEVPAGREEFEQITNYWQVGLAFGREDEPVKLGFLKFDRLGLAYDISPSGELRGIKFVFRSLYEP